MDLPEKFLNPQDNKTKLIFLTALFGVAIFIAITYTAPFAKKDLSQRYAKPSSEAAEKLPTSVKGKSYVEGEFIVKLKSTRSRGLAPLSSSESLEDLDKKYGISEKKVLGDKQPSPAGQGLSIQDAQSFQDKVQVIKDRYPNRTRRAPKDAVVPDLTNIFLYKLSDKNANIDEIVGVYKKHSEVEFAVPNRLYELTYTPNDYYFQTNASRGSSTGSWGQAFDDLWGLHKINAAQAWDVSQGEGIIVAVIDSGVDYNHPDLAQNIWNNPGEVGVDNQDRDKRSNGVDDDNNGYVDDWRGWFFRNCTGIERYCSPVKNDPMDWSLVGHGTHVAGTIAAIGNNDLGVVGVAPKAKIMPLAGFAQSYFPEADIYESLKYAVDNGADVINNSWMCMVCSDSSPSTVKMAIKYSYAMGVITVFASGNLNSDISIVRENYMSENIKVGATNFQDDRYSLSDYGAIDVVAPGEDILSLRKTNRGFDPSLDDVGDFYNRNSGTSMAAPHVSGLVALLLSRYPTLEIEDIRQIIKRTAEDIGNPGIDIYYGAGRIDAGRAMQFNPQDLIRPPYACRTCRSDIDKNGVVNNLDFSILSSCFNKNRHETYDTGKTCFYADINGDGVVNILDYSCLASKFNRTVPAEEYRWDAVCKL